MPLYNELKARSAPGGIYRDAAGNVWPYKDELKIQFGVDLPSSPDSHTPAIFFANYISWISNNGRELQQISLEEHQIAMIIDLARPLKLQFERARRVAEDQQKFQQFRLKTDRSRTDCYVRYLRVLDADEAHEESRRIADLLFSWLPGPPENSRLKALYDHRLAARDLRDGKYRSLLNAPLRK